MFEEIKISSDGYIWCKSFFYEIYTTVNEGENYIFKKGVNLINCEIDSLEVAVSYLISMYNKVNKKMLLSENCAYIDGKKISLDEMLKYSCYIDDTNPLFSKRRTVRTLIKKGIRKSESKYTVEQVAGMFQLSSDRIERPIKAIGNERYRAMAAVAFAYGKQLFCFPWFSKKMVKYYNVSLKYLLNVLEKEKKTIILPTSDITQLEHYADFKI